MEKIFALIKDNVVTNTILFDENTTEELINEITLFNGADMAVDTSEYNSYGIGYTWHNDHFRSPKPYPSWTWENEEWIAPILRPTDAIYNWDEDSQSWVFVENLELPE